LTRITKSKISLKKPEGKRPLRKLRHKFKNNFEIDPKLLVRESAEWIKLTQEKLEWRVLENTDRRSNVMEGRKLLITQVTVSYSVPWSL